MVGIFDGVIILLRVPRDAAKSSLLIMGKHAEVKVKSLYNMAVCYVLLTLPGGRFGRIFVPRSSVESFNGVSCSEQRLWSAKCQINVVCKRNCRQLIPEVHRVTRNTSISTVTWSGSVGVRCSSDPEGPA